MKIQHHQFGLFQNLKKLSNPKLKFLKHLCQKWKNQEKNQKLQKNRKFKNLHHL